MTRRGWLVAALALVLAGATGVQASSTWKLGKAHHLADFALPALVLTLEVGSITAASLYVATRDRGTRWRAGCVLVLVAGLGWWGGLQSYGALVATVVTGVVLFLVDLIARFWHEAAPSIEPVDVDQSPAVDSPGDESSIDEAASVDRHAAAFAAMRQHVDQPVDPETGPIDVETLAWTAVDDVRAAKNRATITEEVKRWQPESVWLPTPEQASKRDPSRPIGIEPETGDVVYTGPSKPEAERAAELIAAADKRPSEADLHLALKAEGYPATKYRAKKYLGNTTRPRRTAEMESVG